MKIQPTKYITFLTLYFFSLITCAQELQGVEPMEIIPGKKIPFKVNTKWGAYGDEKVPFYVIDAPISSSSKLAILGDLQIGVTKSDLFINYIRSTKAFMYDNVCIESLKKIKKSLFQDTKIKWKIKQMDHLKGEYGDLLYELSCHTPGGSPFSEMAFVIESKSMQEKSMEQMRNNFSR